MYLCKYNPQLLNCEWARELVIELSGEKNYINENALLMFTRTQKNINNIFESANFQLLFFIEHNHITESGLNILMSVCKYNP